MDKKYILILLLVASLIGGCSDSSSKQKMRPVEHLAGGEATVTENDIKNFSAHSQNMTLESRKREFAIGNHFFESEWQSANANPVMQNGLGPLFNNNACQNCHVNDGRGQAPDGQQIGFETMLFRLSKSNVDPASQNAMEMGELDKIADTNFGPQLQSSSLPELSKEVRLNVVYTNPKATFSDGTEIELRMPIWHFEETNNELLLNDDIVFSARVAPSMIGLGLLQLINENDIFANVDEFDANNDGISGRANLAWSEIEQRPVLGRFGWKASLPNLTEQSAAAFHQDMGLTSRFHPTENCLEQQKDCLSAGSGTGDFADNVDYEVADDILDAVAFYSHHLAVPQRQNAYTDEVQQGKAIFNEIGCANCHVESYITGNDPQHPELSNQTIFPYTDLLLHDMGPDLADFSRHNGPAPETALTDFRANTREWRTPPLWGIGRAKQVNPDVTFLHDGRARTILEAVLWHGGEAEKSKQNVLKLNAKEREYLLAFLNDL